MASGIALAQDPAVVAITACPAEPEVARKPWRHPVRTEAIRRAFGAARHAATDPVVLEGRSVVLEGRFSYGRASKDLQDEQVVLWAQTSPCLWSELATALTDSDGRARAEVPAALIAEAGGAFEYRWVVTGDLSQAAGKVVSVAHGQAAVVFDIDGTLTTGDDELFQELLRGADPAMHPGSPEVVEAHLRRGDFVVYLTARPYLSRPETSAWLRRRGFPEAPLVTSESLSDMLPRENGAEKFKLGVLERLRDESGLSWVAAYGNATTDICAYARAGIDVTRTFIIGPHAGKACAGFAPSQALSSYPEHLRDWPLSL
jgi:phosphatidate phosphatase PAH1